jgi:hypothetical protein
VSQVRRTLHSAPDEEAAAAALERDRRTDGLPIVVATPKRVDDMLLHAGGLAPDVILGTVGPAGGQITVEKAAINAVMAGCAPEVFPLVIAACEALVDPLFDIGPMQSTTHCVTPLIIVNGPARKTYNVSSDVGALGPGHRTNATLGRALRLIMINVGGGVPGIGDMATLGSPAKFTCCLAEAEEESPFEPFHVSRGFSANDSTVTLLGVEGPHSLVFSAEEAPNNEEFFLRTLAAGFANPASNNIYFGRGMLAVVLNPVHARLLAEKGVTRRQAQERLFEYASTTKTALRKIVGANANISSQDGETLRVVPSPDHFLILVGGAEGGAYSAYFPNWGAGVDGQSAVTKRVRTEDLCETPVSQRR